MGRVLGKWKAGERPDGGAWAGGREGGKELAQERPGTVQRAVLP